MKTELTKILNVAITLSRGSDHLWSLEVRDEASRLILLNVDLDDAAFSNLLSSREARASGAVFSVNPKVGKNREAKEITLTFKGRDELPRAIDQFNAENGEGWFIGEYERNWNSHKATSTKEGYSYRVVVSRHV